MTKLIARFFRWYIRAIKEEMFAKFEFDPNKTYSVDPYMEWQMKTSIGYFKFMTLALPIILLFVFIFR